MNRLERIIMASEIIDKNFGNEKELSEIVVTASAMIALCLHQYNFKGEVLDGAIKAINGDINDYVKALDLIQDEMEKIKKNEK